MEDREPCPLSAGLAAQRHNSRYAGEVEQHEEHEGKGGQWCEACGRDITAVEDRERRDDGFLRRQTRDETDGHFPIEAKRCESRRDELTDSGQIGVLQVA